MWHLESDLVFFIALHVISVFHSLLIFVPLVDQIIDRDKVRMMDDLISRKEAIDAICKACSMEEDYHKCDGYPETSTWCDELVALRALSSAQSEWNNHTVACLLADMFGDTCACNYNGIDEWLPGKCELLNSCPHPVGVACWEQFLKHKAERRTDG